MTRTSGRNQVDELAAALLAGEVVLVPTDTVYGLAASIDRPAAMDHIFELKHRPAEKQLAVLVAGQDQAAGIAVVDDRAERFMEAWWPGPLTLVLPARRSRDGLPTIGVRCPDHTLVRRLAERVGPLATTSANVSGQPTAATLEAVLDQLGHPDLRRADGGRCAGTPSTVVELLEEPRVLREGAITAAQLDL